MIKEIIIKNYRSIKNLKFNPTNLCALIGSNNAGKSNILKALNLLLGEAYPQPKAIKEEDFYNYDTSEPIHIEIEFEPPLPPCRCKEKNSKGEYKEIQAKVFKLFCYKSPANIEDCEFIVISKEGEEYWGNNNVRKLAPLIYIKADRDLKEQLTISDWTLWGKITNRLDKELKQKEGKRKEAMEDMEKALKNLKTPSYERLEESLKENIKAIVHPGLFEDTKLKLSIYDPQHLYNMLRLWIREWELDFNIPNLGSGIQNLILLALFKTYAEIEKEKVILAIEEPEIYLHPHAQRSLYKIFRELTDADTNERGLSPQIFYTTHSPHFVNLSSPEDVFLVRKTKKDGTTVIHTSEKALTENERQELKLLTEFGPERNEIFFASKVMLVEGATEKYSLPYAFERMEYPLDKNTISLISTQGKKNMPFFIKILKEFKIPWVALYDTDKPDDKTNKKIKESAGQTFKDRLFSLDPNFEKELRLSSCSKTKGWEKIKNAIAYFHEKKNPIPPTIKEAIDKLKQLPVNIEENHSTE